MKRYLNNPIIQRSDIPDISRELKDVTSVFNPGAIKLDDKYILLLRVQNRGRETFSIMAESANGVDFNISHKPVKFKGLEKIPETIFHIYDPRITKIGSEIFIMYAMDLESGCYLGLMKTSDFQEVHFLGIVSADDNRNGVLLPEKVKGKYLRYDRPNEVLLEDGPLTGNAIYLSESTDLLKWDKVGKVAGGRAHYWDELIGAGPPPVKTKKGWLLIYHGIAMHYQPIYQVGVMLLDLEDPQKIISRGKYNILEPRELYETTGQVPNVIFPTGLIVEKYDQNGFAEIDSEVKLYYGAADSVIGLATSTILELINFSYK